MTKQVPPPPALDIHPPLINSSNPWASTLDDLRHLHACPSTGAVTTRTSLIDGFGHDDLKHQYIFLDPATHAVSQKSPCPGPQNASLNSLGYSPYTLETYLGWIKTISAAEQQDTTTNTKRRKGFVVSVTGTPQEVSASYKLISQAQSELSSDTPLAMEINLSCPNIPNKPPPAYSKDALGEYLAELKSAISIAYSKDLPRIPIGLKTPPYTYATQFEDLVGALLESCDDGGGEDSKCLISFLTATNTLGSCLAFSSPGGGGGGGAAADLALPGPYGIGGMAGAPLHPLALGNVATLGRLLSAENAQGKLGHIQIIGIGGVLDADGYRRMRAAGASFVGIGTGLGLRGIDIFGEVERGLDGIW